MDDSSPRSAAELVARFVETIGATDNAGLIPFFSNWADLAGTDIAAHSSPIDIRHGSLIVQVDHPGWAQRLAIKRNEIIAAIRRNHPGVNVRNIHTYVSDEAPEAGPRTPVGGQTKRPGLAGAEDHRRALPGDDNEFSSSLERLGRAIADNDRKGRHFSLRRKDDEPSDDVG